MTYSSRYRALSRTTYQRAIEVVKARHPWLARQVVEPAPGHILVLEQFLVQVESLMRPEDFTGLTLLCATTLRDKLSLRMELVSASVNRDRALLDLIEVARHAAQHPHPIVDDAGDVFGSEMHTPADFSFSST